jgi:hypothetical protein
MLCAAAMNPASLSIKVSFAVTGSCVSAAFNSATIRLAKSSASAGTIA